jgi:hypothetical protein
MTPDLCIYHGGCADGFTAAWAIWRRWPYIIFKPATYGDEIPSPLLSAGKHIVIVDFSYPLAALEELGERAASVTVLDHHKTAEEALRRYNWAGPFPDDRRGILARFDMEKSGARLAWEFAFGDEPAPMLVDYAEDRDLWRFQLPRSRDVNLVVSSSRFDMGEWEMLERRLGTEPGFQSVANEGAAIHRKQLQDITSILGVTRRQMKIGGQLVPTANLPHVLASEAGNMLAKDVPFAATYFDNAAGRRVFSLRSTAGGLDVSEIAKRYGGGGHRNAAGFSMPRGWEGEQ